MPPRGDRTQPRPDEDDRGLYSFSFEASDRPGRRVPLLAYALLVAAIAAVSSAALVLVSLEDQGVPPFTLAAWRLQASTLVLAPLCVWQARTAPRDIVRDALRAWWLLAAAGVALALHFGAWIWGLEHTSLPHSLLFVTATPLLLVVLALAMRVPVSRGEGIGAAAAFLGMAILGAGASVNRSVTVAGDLSSLLGAMGMVAYLSVGRSLRGWMPVFVYAAPVTGVAALLLTLLSIIADRSEVLAGGAAGTFGYLASWKALPLVTYLAFGPGLVGHTGLNTLLRFFSPLVISVALTLEPLLGSILAWAFGVSGVPGPLTWLGGAVVMTAMAYLTYCESLRTGQREKKAAVSAAMRAALDDDGNTAVEMTPFTIIDDEEDEVFDDGQGLMDAQ